MPPQMPQERPGELGHINGLEVVRRRAEIQPHVLTCRGHREGSQGREAVMRVVVAPDLRLSLRRPGALARGDEQKAALIQEGEMGPKSLGFFLSPATGSAAHGPWLGRRTGWAAAPALDSSSPDGVRASRHGRGDSGRQTAPESPQRCASRSIARWESHGPWPLHQLQQVLPLLAGQFAWLPRHRRGCQSGLAPSGPASPPLYTPLRAIGSHASERIAELLENDITVKDTPGAIKASPFR